MGGIRLAGSSDCEDTQLGVVGNSDSLPLRTPSVAGRDELKLSRNSPLMATVSPIKSFVMILRLRFNPMASDQLNDDRCRGKQQGRDTTPQQDQRRALPFHQQAPGPLTKQLLLFGP